jgi:hypothetical protein
LFMPTIRLFWKADNTKKTSPIPAMTNNNYVALLFPSFFAFFLLFVTQKKFHRCHRFWDLRFHRFTGLEKHQRFPTLQGMLW